LIRNGKDDHRIRFEMRDRIHAVLKYMDKKYGENRWANDERACADPQFVTLQLWLDMHATPFEENFNSPEWQKVYQLRMQGYGPVEIVKALGITKSKAVGRLHAMQIHGKLDNPKPIIRRPKIQPNRNLAYPKPPREELIALIDSGMNKTEIAEKLNVGRKVLYKWLRQDDLIEYSKKANWRARTEAVMNV